jgi:pyridoxal phosphate enzyme (YggS family)
MFLVIARRLHRDDVIQAMTGDQHITRLAAGLPPNVTLLGVSKGVDSERIRAAVTAGITDLGENRVQEALAKMAALRDLAIRWHLIGHLQANKIRRAVDHFDWIHSVDSVTQAAAIGRVAEGLGKRQRVLIQVNVAGEATKGGFSPADAWLALPEIGKVPGLDVRGLMTIAPYSDEPEAARPVFRAMRELAERAGAQHWPGVVMDHLSMGMSGDYQVALAEGATMIRLGRAVFGTRAQR